MAMMDINDTLSLRGAIASLWWKHKRIADSLEIGLQSIPIVDQPQISIAAAKAILQNLGCRHTDDEERSVESFMRRLFS